MIAYKYRSGRGTKDSAGKDVLERDIALLSKDTIYVPTVEQLNDPAEALVDGSIFETQLRFFKKLGAGEILLTSMDCDGTKAGYDIELTKAISSAVKIPVIASGGAGTKEHFYDALTTGGADAALAASLFHYKELEIMELKEYLSKKGVSVRM